MREEPPAVLPGVFSTRAAGSSVIVSVFRESGNRVLHFWQRPDLPKSFLLMRYLAWQFGQVTVTTSIVPVT
jgi:hypothetical protein